MTTQKQIPNSNTHPAAMTSNGRNAPLLTPYAVDAGYKTWILFVIILVAVCGAVLVLAQDQAAKPPARQQQYQISSLPSVGGTAIRGNSINNQMRALPNFPGGNNGFATGANNLRQVAGWAETGVHDDTCCCQDEPRHQVFQFLPAMWTLGPPDNQIHKLPLIPGDTSGAATAINDNGQIVGISGICDQAEGRRTARHAVLWENGTVTDIYPDAPAPWWNTPTAINQHGDVVGFAGDPAFVDGANLHAFIRTRDNGIKVLKPLRGRVPEHVDSEAYGINEARQVVGASCDADSNCRAVIWDHGVYPTDLNDHKGGYSAILETAKDINDNGEITGRAITDPVTGAREAYLAVPVP